MSIVSTPDQCPQPQPCHPPLFLDLVSPPALTSGHPSSSRLSMLTSDNNFRYSLSGGIKTVPVPYLPADTTRSVSSTSEYGGGQGGRVSVRPHSRTSRSSKQRGSPTTSGSTSGKLSSSSLSSSGVSSVSSSFWIMFRYLSLTERLFQLDWQRLTKSVICFHDSCSRSKLTRNLATV